MTTKFLGAKSSQQKATNGGRRRQLPSGIGAVMVMFDREYNAKYSGTIVKKDSNDQPLLDADGNQIEVPNIFWRVVVVAHGPVVHNVDGKLVDAPANAYVGYGARLKLRSSDTMIEEDLAAGVLSGLFDGSMEAELDRMLAEDFTPFALYSNASYTMTKNKVATTTAYNPGTLHTTPNS